MNFIQDFLDLLNQNIGQVIGAYFATVSALIVLYVTRLVEQHKAKKEEKKIEEQKKEKYGNLLWTLSQELSLNIQHANLIDKHITEVVRVAKLKGEVISKKNTLLFTTSLLKLYHEKLLDDSYQHPLLTSKLSVFIATLETFNMSLDFEELANLSSKFESKPEFEKSLDTYLEILENEYIESLQIMNTQLQTLIEEELKFLKPDLKRLKNENLTEKYIEILKPVEK